MKATANQQVLITALAAIVLPKEESYLLARREQVLSRAAGLPLKHLGVVDYPFEWADWRGIIGVGEFDWIVFPSDKDPAARTGLPMPAECKDALQRIHKAGCRFDEVWIAHEISKSLYRDMNYYIPKAGHLLPNSTHTLTRVLEWMINRMPATSTDPIILGVNKSNLYCDLFYLTHWSW